jgi:NAD-dependent deacetylase
MAEDGLVPEGLVQALHVAHSVAVLTGAGISAESGIPTFRDAQTGLWAKYNPEDLATPSAFRRNPRLVWEWYAWRRSLVAQASPNPGHIALAEMEQHIPRFTLITQNVDGLHRRAGSKNVIELHGNIVRTKCFQENVIVDTWAETEEVPPRCPRCRGLLRPDVVWFGEMLPEQALNDALEAAKTCDVFLSIGTSGLVEPAASLPFIAQSSGATVAIINPDVTAQALSTYYRINGPAGKVLPKLVYATWTSG